MEDETKPEGAGGTERIVGFDAIFDAEITEIEKRRKVGRNSTRTGAKQKGRNSSKRSSRSISAETRDTLAGLSLSGGGIRSAAFCLGAVQALDAIPLSKKAQENSTLFSRMDYMSSVSGGGYTAGCISAAMTGEGAPFPFPSRLEQDEPETLRHIRDHSNYLFPRGGMKEKVTNLAAYLRGVFAHLPLIAGILLVLSSLTLFFHPSLDGLERSVADRWFGNLASWLLFIGDGAFLLTRWMAIVVATVLVLWAIARSIGSGPLPLLANTSGSGSSRLANEGEWFGEYGTAGARFVAGLVFLLLAVFAVELQPKMINALWDVRELAGKQETSTDPPKTVNADDNPAAAADEARATSGETAAIAAAQDEQAPSTPDAGDGEKPGGTKPGPGFFSFENALNLVTRVTTVLGAVAAFAAALRGVLGLGEASSGTHSGPLAIFNNYSRKVIYLLIGLALPLALWLVYLYLTFWGMRSLNDDFSHAPKWLQYLFDLFVPWYTSLLNLLPVSWQITFVQKSIITVPGALYFTCAFALLALSALLRANANSPHNLYRDRLADAFLVASGNGENEDRAPTANRRLHDIGAGDAPFHLINAALNIQGSEEVNKRGRNAGFFTFSKTHCGSAETGYLNSRELVDLDSRFTLASAVAVSAAAASTAMGSLSMKPLALTLAVLNVRLGYWFRNPRYLQEQARDDLPWYSETPYNYLYREVSNRLHEKSPLVYLSDGGHIENLGLYSLLKRRCRFVVVVDAEADPEMSFGALVKVQRYARIDLGVRINIRFDQIQKASRIVRDRLDAKGRKKPAGKTAPLADDEKLDTELPHCALGIIEYPEQSGLDGGSPKWRNRGLILYVKSSLSGDENDYVRDYARVNRAFPHETTGDQFFSEEQFEVYRALGFHAVHGALTGDAPVQLNETVEKLPGELCGEHGPIDGLLERLGQLFNK